MAIGQLFLTVLDGSGQDSIIDLSGFRKEEVFFGRARDNDIVLDSSIVSKYHGSFVWAGGGWTVYDNHSTNGIFQNGKRLENKHLMSGDKLLIGYEAAGSKVTLLFSNSSPRGVCRKFSLSPGQTAVIGRAPECDICIGGVSVLKRHCRIVSTGKEVFAEKTASRAPVQYNGESMSSRQKLSDMDRLLIGDTQFFYYDHTLSCIPITEGLSFEVSHLSKTVGRGRRRKKISDDVSFSVNAGEFVAIIGGSGAGKSTLLKCLCGCSEISGGRVTVDGDDLAASFSTLRELIGYVPQQDIVYDDLTLERMLYYTAKLRMPEDSGAEEIRRRIDSALEAVELTDKRELLIRKLSGGQRKRASIAVELLAEPRLFFLDEPTSGLDPGTERNLMEMLWDMSRKGKTVVLVTHTTLNLAMCDKIVVMGRGGRLCFCGSPGEALRFFNVEQFVDIYNLINEEASSWAELYKIRYLGAPRPADKNTRRKKSGGPRASSLRQLGILVQRYIRLQFRDVRKLLIQLFMAPGLGALLYVAFWDSFPFQTSGDTQKLALTLGCCAFWIGLFNTIQEICKERPVYSRERMSNLKLGPYVFSKLLVNGVYDLVQSALLLGTVTLLLGVPETGMQIKNAPWLELFITTFLTMFSASCLGLAVSAAVTNSNQATIAAPVLLIPQILFSGVVVELEGLINTLSHVVSCRYACVAYCTTADINNLPSEFKLTLLGYEEGETVVVSSMYSYTGGVSAWLEELLGEDLAAVISNPVMMSWLLLLLLSAIAIAAAFLLLKRKGIMQK